MDMYFERSLAVLLVALSWTIVGCGEAGSERGEVRGKVTFDGAPVESGSIAFTPIEGTKGPSVGGAIKGGEYHIPRGEGPVSGPHRVMVLGTRQTGRKVREGEGGEDFNALVDEVEMFIPRKYNVESSLTVEIEAGTNELNFDLEGGGK